MTVDDSSKRPFLVRYLSVSGLLLLILFGCPAVNTGTQSQVQTSAGMPPWRDTTGVPGVYPIGEAVDVYRTVLDLFFVDGDESPSIIVMQDTAEPPSGGGPCPADVCEQVWPHKSKIDKATMLDFARFSPKRPRMIPFGYRIPVVFLSFADEARMRAEGQARLVASHPSNYVPEMDLLSEFDRKYPGAWGRLRLSRVGFNPPHTEALIQASFMCGIMCNSHEILFLRKIDGQWTVIERIPNSTEGFLPWGGMRYRGPAGRIPTESEILVSSAGDRTASRAEGVDRATVYRAVLDSLYNFQGESPRRIVVTDWFQIDERYPSTFPAHKQPIEASTLQRYAVMSVVRGPVFAGLDYRLPVSTLPRDSMPALERLGAPLGKLVDNSNEYSDASPFWLGFRQHYPGAWGMVGFSGVAFNQQHTQALVFTDHECGQTCHNADTWLLDKSGEKWRIAERIPRAKDNHWALDSLRYLGVDTDPNAYRPRRLHGLFVNAVTGRALPGLKVLAAPGSKSYALITDSAGRYAVENLPIVGWMTLTVPCPEQPSRQPLMVAQIKSRPGLDSTIDVGVDFRKCVRQKRAHPLVAGAISPLALKSTYPSPEVAAVYWGVLDALYPRGGASKGPILLQPFTFRACDWCVDAEMPRLIRQGTIDSSTAKSFLKLPTDSVWFRPNFEYTRKVIILSPAEQKFLLDQADDIGGYDKKDVSLIGLAKDAYPGADAIWSLSRVAFNDARTEALVQAGTRSDFWLAGETLLLHKIPGGWRVVRRHLERGETSGERVGDRCEPTDAPSGRPSLEQLEPFMGDVYISSVGTSPQLRGHSGTMHLRFVATDTLQRYYWVSPIPGDTRKPFRWKNKQVLATVQIIDDSTGKARTGIAGSFERSGNVATITFMEHKEGYITVDGWFEQYHIMNVKGREFFGNWFTQSGPTIPWKGYFCGRLGSIPPIPSGP
jgi:hypothetical protein